MIQISDGLKAKVEREYQSWFRHVETWRNDVRSMKEQSLTQKAPDGNVMIDLVKENIEYEKALFMTDSMDVRFVSDEGFLGRKMTENTAKVAKYDYDDMEMDYTKEEIIDNNAYEGVAITVSDIWDNDEIQPIIWTVDPLTVIPDPKCTKGSQMRFIGFERRLDRDMVENNDAFDVKGIDLDNLDDSQAQKDSRYANGQYNIWTDTNDWLVPVYDHMTTWEGKKWLLTFLKERSECIRMLEIETLSNAEKLTPTKVKYPVQIHRRKPKVGRFAGYSILEEVQNMEDIVTLLKNLEIKQAILSARGGDTLIGSNLSIDVAELAGSDAGGRYIPVTMNSQENMSTQIYQMQVPSPSQWAMNTAQSLIERSKNNTGYKDSVTGTNAPWNQTAREVQQIAQSASKIVALIGNNYMRWMKEFWNAWYRSYALNMSPRAKKTIALFDNGGTALKLKKSDFITDGKVLIEITSESQEAVKDEKAVTKMLAMAELIVPNLPKWYPLDRFLRHIIDKSSVKGITGNVMIPKSPEEIKAENMVDVINLGRMPMTRPEPGESLSTYLEIVRQASDNEFKDAVIQDLTDLMVKKQAQAPMMQTWNSSPQSSSMAMNSLSNQQSLATPTM